MVCLLVRIIHVNVCDGLGNKQQSNARTAHLSNLSGPKYASDFA